MNLRTARLHAEIERQRRIAEELGATGWRPLFLLMAVAADPDCPLVYRLMAADRATRYTEPRPASTVGDQIPLMRFWTPEQKEDYDRRLCEDMRQHPECYSPEFRAAMGVEVAPPLLIEAQAEKD